MLGYLFHAPYWDAILSNVASWCTLLSYFTTMLLLPIYPCWPALSACVAAWKTLLGCYTKNWNAFVSIHFVNILIHVSISRASVGLLRPGNDRLWSLFYSCLSFGWFFANLPSQAPAATNSHLRSSQKATTDTCIASRRQAAMEICCLWKKMGLTSAGYQRRYFILFN